MAEVDVVETEPASLAGRAALLHTRSATIEGRGNGMRNGGSRRSPSCRNRIAPWLRGSMPSSKPARHPSRRNSGTGCPGMPRTARSSASSKVRRSQQQVSDVRLQRHGEPRRRHHVADLLRSDRVDRRRRGKDRRAREESGELTQQKFLDQAAGDPVKAQHLRKAFYAHLALKSAQSRREGQDRQGRRLRSHWV